MTRAPPATSGPSIMKPRSPAAASAISSASSYSHHSISVMKAPSLQQGTRASFVPSHFVALGQRDRRGGAPGARLIGPGMHVVRVPAGADAVDPFPLRLDLVAPHEQGRIAFDQIQQQPVVRDPPPRARELMVEREVERHFAQADALAV